MKNKRTIIKRFLIEYKNEICIKYEYSNGDKEIYSLKQIVESNSDSHIVCPHKTTQVLPVPKKKNISDDITKEYNKY